MTSIDIQLRAKTSLTYVFNSIVKYIIFHLNPFIIPEDDYFYVDTKCLSFILSIYQILSNQYYFTYIDYLNKFTLKGGWLLFFKTLLIWPWINLVSYLFCFRSNWLTKEKIIERFILLFQYIIRNKCAKWKFSWEQDVASIK
jgi:hypothetical protein